MSDRIAFCGGTIVELDASGAHRVRQDDLLVEGGRVVGVGVPIPDGAQRIDCTGALVMPGLVCAHTHLYSALARGMPPPSVAPANFVEILERVWWKLDRALDAEAIEVSALVGAVDAVRAGATTLVDHHASPSLIAGSLDLVDDALRAIGLRRVLCYEATERAGMAGAHAGVDENERFLRKIVSDKTGMRAGLVGAHAAFTVGKGTAEALADVARRYRAGVHIHVAEDVVDARKDGETIVEWLAKTGLLDGNSLLAHCVHVDEAGAERIAAARAHVVHNARSNQNNAVGYARPGRFGGQLLLGTDGIGADMIAEACASFLAWRGAGDARGPAFDPLAVLARNSTYASSLLGVHIGAFTQMCKADVIVVPYESPTPITSDNVFGHLLFGLGALNGRVRDVFVDGKPVMRDRRLVAVDEAALMARARDVANRLWARMA